MSARQAVDESVGWPNLPCCPRRHKVSVPCPPSGVWLVLTLCPACDEPKQLYCRTHRDRHMPALPAVLPDLIGPPGVDVRQRAAGDNNDNEGD